MPSTVGKPFQELSEGIGFSVSVLPFSRPIYGNIIGSFPHLLTFFDFCKQINGIVTITVKRPIVYFFHTFRNNHLFQCAISESLIADLSICVALSDFTNPYSAQNLGRQITIVCNVRFSSMQNISPISTKNTAQLAPDGRTWCCKIALFLVWVIGACLIAEANTDL